MGLREAILVCLTEGPQSGYDLKKTFDTSIGFFWHADHQRIYRALKTLHEDGLVAAEAVAQSGKPDKKLYTLTDAGRAALRQWSIDGPSAPPSVKDEMMVRLYALDEVDVGAVRKQIMARRSAHAERLSLYRHIENVRYREKNADDLRSVGRHLGLKLGMRYEREWVDWCDEAISSLAPFVPQSEDEREPADA